MPIVSSRSSILLRTSSVQIRWIPPSNIFAVLAVRYARYQINQKDSDTLRHDSVQTTEQAKGTLLPFSTLWLIYLLYELPNKPDRPPLSGTFTACLIAKHQISQMDFYPLTSDGSTIRNPFGLDGDQCFGRRLIYTFYLICKYHSGSSFKAIWRRGSVDMMMTRLTCIV